MEFGKLKVDAGLQTAELNMESKHSDMNPANPGWDQNQNTTSNDKIQCSVCDENYDNITEYTHHLNMHLNSVQPAKDIENSLEKQESDSKQTETYSPFDAKPEFPNETGNKMELDTDLYDDQMTKDIEYQPALNIEKQTTNIIENCENYLKKSESGFIFKCKAEFQNERGNNSEFNVGQATEDIEYSQKWQTDLNESESDSLSETKLEFPSEEEKKVFHETSKQKTVHKTLKVFTCTFCDKSFTQKVHLTGHINAVHLKLKSFSCTLCDKSFAGKDVLTGHVKSVHEKLKPFSCTFCDKTFSIKSNLSRHVDGIHKKGSCETSKQRMVHNTLKVFTCTLCDKSFSRKGSLSEHVTAVHDKLKPFSCTLCDRSFSAKRFLNQHVDNVHKKLKPFFCTLCDNSFGPLKIICVF